MNRYVYLLLVLALGACDMGGKEDTLFKKVAKEDSGLDFNNTILENDILNILDYEYMYNGGGVGIADFNSDGLPDIFFSGNMVSSRLYLNQGNLKFKDVTKEAGVITDAWCTGISIVDINNDGKPDIHVATAHDLELKKAKNYIFINVSDAKGNIKFENRAEEMGLADDSYSIQAAWLDYDNDNDLDLFLANNSEESYPKNNPMGQRKDGRGKSTDKLYRNEGMNENGIPVFKDASEEAGVQIEGWSLGVVVLDINRDQRPDIYVANDFMSNDILYVNNGDGTFTNEVSEYFKHQSHNSMGIDAADINNDSELDLLVLDMLPEDNLRKKTMFGQIPHERFNRSLAGGYQPQYVRNVLQVNNGNGSFSDLGYFSGLAATDWSWSPLIADFDNDGLRDVYITNGYKKDITDMDFVDYNNKATTFGSIEHRRAKLVEQVKKMPGIKKSNFFFKNLGDIRFRDDTENAGLAYPSYSNGAAYADLDLDGDLDLVMNNIDDPVFLFENKTNKENNNANYLRIRLPLNEKGVGAKVWVYSGEVSRYAEHYPQRGYLSSVEPVLHFGLGDVGKVDSLKIIWPNGQVSVSRNVKVNTELAPAPNGKDLVNDYILSDEKTTPPLYFTPLASAGLIPYSHTENTFDDFKKWPLHFRSYSKSGPIMAIGDINGDRLDDIFIGGPSNQPGKFFMQKQEGGFQVSTQADSLGQLSEDTGAVLFDSDGDGDLDLYCASGSSENYANPELYQDRLYLNDGKGSFTPNTKALPKMDAAAGCVIPIDYDNDGDLDLFVGGRIDPSEYPMSPQSYLLQNDRGIFTDKTEKFAPDLRKPGMVTDAYATDLDQDGWADLVLVGEWMPIQVYYNKKGSFVLDTQENGLENTNGWWNSIEASDFDQDGDLDFVVGNWGLNNPFKATIKQPISIYTKDYDKNGTMEAIFTYYNGGREYIAHPRGTLNAQLPGLIRKIKDYRTYGKLEFSEIFDYKKDKDISVFRACELASVYIENLGDGKFKYSPLPDMAQWSPIFDFEIDDVNQDGFSDILAVGNFYDTEVLTGSFDAGNGTCLLGKGDGTFETIAPNISGFKVPGEARSIKKLSTANPKDVLYVIGLQNDSLQILRKLE